MTAEDQATLLSHVSTDGDKHITFDELERFLGVPPTPKQAQQHRKSKERQEREQLKAQQDEKRSWNPPLSDLPSFLEVERHGRKSFNWFDD